MGVFVQEESPGSPADALEGLGSTLAEAAGAAASDQSVPDGAKAAFQAAADAFAKGLEILKGGEAPEQEPEQGGPVPMEQGRSKAVPMSMGRPS